MIVDAIMGKPPVVAPPGTTVQRAAALMRERRVGSVVVVGNGRLQGIITEHDIVRIVAEGRDARKTAVDDVMTSPVATIDASAAVHDAAEAMKAKRLKRLVVMRGNEVRGVVTVRDVAYASPELSKRYQDVLRQGWQD